MKLTVLGSRGSVPVSGKKYNEYGGATSCYMVEAGNQVIFLDAGSGIVLSPDIPDDKEVTILMSHQHLDHTMGLPFFHELSKKDRKITLYGQTKEHMSIDMQLGLMFSPAFWPLKPDEYPANLIYRELPDVLNLGDVSVEKINLNHPGGSLGFKLIYEDKKLVYYTDHEEDGDENIVEFSKGADLILFDAQYTNDEYQTHKGYGHSSIDTAVDFAQKSGCKKMLIIHHDPYHDDDFLDKIGRDLEDKGIFLAKEEQELEV